MQTLNLADLDRRNLLDTPSALVGAGDVVTLVWQKTIGLLSDTSVIEDVERSEWFFPLPPIVRAGSDVVALQAKRRLTSRRGASGPVAVGVAVQDLVGGTFFSAPGFGQANLKLEYVVPKDVQAPIDQVAATAATSPRFRPDPLGLAGLGDLVGGAFGGIKTLLLLVLLVLIVWKFPISSR